MTLQAFEIPLVPNQNQQFTVSLSGVQYSMTVRWNTPGQCWVLDIEDINANPVLEGLPLITGADLLEQYQYLGFGGQLIVQTDFDVNAVPTFENLGTTGHLYFVTDIAQ